MQLLCAVAGLLAASESTPKSQSVPRSDGKIVMANNGDMELNAEGRVVIKHGSLVLQDPPDADGQTEADTERDVGQTLALLLDKVAECTSIMQAQATRIASLEARPPCTCDGGQVPKQGLPAAVCVPVVSGLVCSV